MSLVGSLRVCDTVGVHKTHYSNYGEQARHQGGQYLRGFGGRHNQHEHFTPSAIAFLQLQPPLFGR